MKLRKSEDRKSRRSNVGKKFIRGEIWVRMCESVSRILFPTLFSQRVTPVCRGHMIGDIAVVILGTGQLDFVTLNESKMVFIKACLLMSSLKKVMQVTARERDEISTLRVAVQGV